MRDTILGVLFLAAIAGAYAHFQKMGPEPYLVSAHSNVRKPIAKGNSHGERARQYCVGYP